MTCSHHMNVTYATRMQPFVDLVSEHRHVVWMLKTCFFNESYILSSNIQTLMFELHLEWWSPNQKSQVVHQVLPSFKDCVLIFAVTTAVVWHNGSVFGNRAANGKELCEGGTWHGWHRSGGWRVDTHVSETAAAGTEIPSVEAEVYNMELDMTVDLVPEFVFAHVCTLEMSTVNGWLLGVGYMVEKSNIPKVWSLGLQDSLVHVVQMKNGSSRWLQLTQAARQKLPTVWRLSWCLTILIVANVAKHCSTNKWILQSFG